ncbi:MAG: sensor histidine kinase [Flammeovirgaceae bacterium]
MNKPNSFQQLLKIGLAPNTSIKEAESHRFLILMSLLMAAGGLLWGTLSLFFELYIQSLVPYGYTCFTILNLIQFSKTKNFGATRFCQVIMSLSLPFVFQWMLGGFISSGSIMIWAMLALTGAITFEHLNASIKWLISYLLFMLISSLADGYFREHYTLNTPDHVKTFFFSINIGLVSSLIFGLMFFFKSRLTKREKELLITHHHLQSSEEELRQNAEELLSINESLGAAQQELKNALTQEQTSRQELENTNQRLQATYRELLASEQALLKKSQLLEAVNENLEQTHLQLQHTLRLEIDSRKKLEEANRNLKDAQTQLVQSEKMASLGEMTAGIAHEINNPLNFISGGAQSLDTTLNELLYILRKYQDLEHAASESEKAQAKETLKQVKAAFNIEELIEEANHLLKDVNDGANRATEIVRSLQNFSRNDAQQLVMADIHDAIDSALVILRNKMMGYIEISKHFDPSIPQIKCYPTQLNQVFMNIISNAIDAIESKGNIKIRTKDHQAHVEVLIQDNGMGMSAEVQAKVFEPFYTTKALGKGTGLGMSITHSIIKKHQGSIEIASEEGLGTTFILKLPKNLSDLLNNELENSNNY